MNNIKSSSKFSNISLPIVFGHRGASGIAYENTFEAFDKAIELGADGLETDCWLLADGEIVLFHDKRLNDENISKMTIEQVKSITLPNGQKIPTLREFLEKYSNSKSTKGNKLWFSIDLQDLKVGSAIVPLLEDFGVSDRTFLCGSSMLHLKKVRRVNENVLLIASNIPDHIKMEDLTPESKIMKLNIAGFNIEAKEYLPEMGEILHKKNLLCFIWDLHDEEKLRKYIKFKPDAIYTNYPDKARKIIDGKLYN